MIEKTCLAHPSALVLYAMAPESKLWLMGNREDFVYANKRTA